MKSTQNSQILANYNKPFTKFIRRNALAQIHKNKQNQCFLNLQMNNSTFNKWIVKNGKWFDNVARLLHLV